MRVLLFEGVFYERSGSIWVETEDGHESITESLKDFHGQTTRIFMHHIGDPLLSDRWGLGSCLWQPSECPFGHHKNPYALFHFDETGRLDYKTLSLHTSNGVKKVPLEYLCGHKSRLTSLSVPEEIPFDFSATEARAEGLRDILSKLKNSLENL